ncbi:MAG: hypothetical protein KGY80_02780 [Candidatus Thorarchaeota archaeon]|nr:hypothetical protein [Candidatus Thorarchaeota archaeon]
MSPRKLAFFDETQNERGKLDSTYSDLGNLLRNNGFDVQPYTEYMILADEIKRADVIVFGCPNSSKLRKEEITALEKFVDDGGGLILLSLSGGDKGLMNNQTKLSQKFGIRFQNTAVKDSRNNAGLPTMVISDNVVDHPITENVNELLYPSGCSLQTSKKATPVATTSGTGDPANAQIVAVTEHGEGRVLCIGSYEIWRNGGGIQHQGNKTFAVNAFNWLTAQGTPMADVTREETEEPVSKTKSEPAGEYGKVAKDTENALRRLISTVFELQDSIEETQKRVSAVNENIESLREEFRSFAESTQSQLGLVIPTKQFKSQETSTRESIENEIKSIEKEMGSITKLKEHVESRHSSGAISKEVFEEQTEKLTKRLEGLAKRLSKKQDELESSKADKK